MHSNTCDINIMTTEDKKFMHIALNYAKRTVGLTAPNPSVGCIIVKNNQIIGVGNTAQGGRPHAETVALAMAADKAEGAIAYVTLEPCCHYGKTPPCAKALIDAGISKVVIATKDPYEKVAGGGIKMLQKAGIEVVTGVLEQKARQVNAGFLSVQELGRPYVTLKLATSTDGMIAKNDGKQLWLTGDIAKSYSHMLRAKNDAIMVGSGTVIADTPSLDCRLPGMADQSPIRIIMDGRGRYAQEGKLRVGKGADIDADPHDLAIVLNKLAEKGITRLLVEGGSALATSFLKADLIDELIWIKAPITIAKDGLPAFLHMDIADIENCKKNVIPSKAKDIFYKILHYAQNDKTNIKNCSFSLESHLMLGEDEVRVYRKV